MTSLCYHHHHRRHRYNVFVSSSVLSIHVFYLCVSVFGIRGWFTKSYCSLSLYLFVSVSASVCLCVYVCVYVCVRLRRTPRPLSRTIVSQTLWHQRTSASSTTSVYLLSVVLALINCVRGQWNCRRLVECTSRGTLPSIDWCLSGLADVRSFVVLYIPCPLL